MQITPETPVGEIAAQVSAAIPVLEQLRIDYCCEGRHTLAEACAGRDLSVGPVLDRLKRVTNGNSDGTHWQLAPLRELIDHITHKHHAFARRHLDLILNLAEQVERRHGKEHPELFQLSEALGSISGELMHHFLWEENVLFPSIAQLEAGELSASLTGPEGIGRTVTHLMTDHGHTGDELHLLREITNNYQTPVDACTTCTALYGALAELEHDLRQHIHLENNILFPRALVAAGEHR